MPQKNRLAVSTVALMLLAGCEGFTLVPLEAGPVDGGVDLAATDSMGSSPDMTTPLPHCGVDFDAIKNSNQKISFSLSALANCSPPGGIDVECSTKTKSCDAIKSMPSSPFNLRFNDGQKLHLYHVSVKTNPGMKSLSLQKIATENFMISQIIAPNKSDFLFTATFTIEMPLRIVADPGPNKDWVIQGLDVSAVVQ